MHVGKGGCMGRRTWERARMYFKLYFYLLENLSWLTRNFVQFADLLSLLISLVVSECTNQIKMAQGQTGALTCIERTTGPVNFCNRIC